MTKKGTRKAETKTAKTAPKRRTTPQASETVSTPPTATAAPPLAWEPSAPPVVKVTKEERHRMIAEAAYYLSLRRGPSSDPLKNWLDAEAQIDEQLRREGRL